MKPLFKLSLSFLAFLLFISATMRTSAAEKFYYQIKIYHLKTQQQEDRLDNYLQSAYLPAMHKMGIQHIGVFKPVDRDTADRKVYVLTPFTSWNQLENAGQKLLDDQQYVSSGAEYIDAQYKDIPYTRMETIILRAFPKMPAPAVPNLTGNKTDRVYELRSYESATEKYNLNKVRMFNVGDEVALFKRLGFNAVFYAEVLAGSHMPNLMYMTTFNDRADRDKHWNTFSNDPEWKTLVAKPEYQHNVSKADILFLHPTAYSDF
ncbi:MAG: hypothetical protein JWP94_230 [Mucilaginibacter sp.]|nr:hypothetical protein [Mucilaginibacter sp.]